MSVVGGGEVCNAITTLVQSLCPCWPSGTRDTKGSTRPMAYGFVGRILAQTIPNHPMLKCSKGQKDVRNKVNIITDRPVDPSSNSIWSSHESP